MARAIGLRRNRVGNFGRERDHELLQARDLGHAVLGRARDARPLAGAPSRGDRMRWPWSKREPERRQGEPLAGQVGDLFFNLAANQAETADPSGLSALEAAAGLYAGAFAAARVTPSTPATAVLTPSVRALMGRNLIRRGEDVHLIQVHGGRVRLLPAGSWHVRGPADEDDWLYYLYRYGASESTHDLVEGARVVHARYAVHSSRPWQGVAPLQWATRTGTLAASLETRLGEEAGGRLGIFSRFRPRALRQARMTTTIRPHRSGLIWPRARAARCWSRRRARVSAGVGRTRRKATGNRANSEPRPRMFSRPFARMRRSRCSPGSRAWCTRLRRRSWGCCGGWNGRA